MTPALRIFITLTDTLFVLYWLGAALVELDVININRGLMYADYDHYRVVAWNWSFFPLDIAFSVAGLWAVSAFRRGDAIWKPLAIISLTLTMTAGGMAISYWLILREFDPTWFLPNLLLVIWPLYFLPGLISRTAQP